MKQAMNDVNHKDESPPPPNRAKKSSAGGVFIALLSIGGTILGGLMGQPTIGLLAGIALGVALALALWWNEEHR